MRSQADQASVVLYVDDEEMACKYFVRIAGLDYDVLTANSVDAAIAILTQEHGRIGIIVTDYRMPGKDGGELLRQIERDHPHIVRILITAYADKELLLKTVNSSEVFRILEKPLEAAEVKHALQLALDLARERVANRQKLLAINETLSFLAHEMNTPLATIVNFARGIAQRAADARIASGIHHEDEQIHVHAATERAALAINDNARYCLIVLSSFVDSVRGAGLRVAENRGVSANHLLNNLLDTYPTTPAQRSQIHVQVLADFPIFALPNCVSLVLSTLLNNALRALHSRVDPKLHIVIQTLNEPQIVLIDNGPGIPEAVLAHLLVDPVTTHAADGGSGRGMIFCNRIMQSFGGSMLIASEASLGTRITLKFPPLRT